jgi:D-serine deaminase-like pyridoxal phosphate-dependent protein
MTRVSRRHFLTQSASAGVLGYASRMSAADQATARNTIEPGDPRQFLKQPVTEVPTPALLVDLDVFERNLRTLAAFLKGKKTTFRPHGKAHKSPAVGHLQLASGAGGLCAAKLGEAEVLIGGGITDVLITAEVVGRRKIQRMVTLAGLAPNVKVVVDNEENVADLSTAALAARRRINVAIDVNVGQNRTGLDTPGDVVALAQAIARHKGVELIGLQAYGGNNQHIVGFANRRAAAERSLERAAAARLALEKAGFAVRLQSVGGTGTYNIDTDYPGVTEIQPGSYIFMDAHYRAIGGRDQEAFSEFGTSLSVLTTVISRPAKDRAITDGGNKALSTDESMPEPKNLTGVSYRPGGDEYGIITLQNPSRDLRVGDHVEFVPGHCDTTVNLHNVFYGVRNGVVEEVWPIEGRGRTD